ncbi:MAG: hypothetical protein DHS20C15_01790 [Planctomycetota bacterium]|nr:MAG: hypothetical protein DHS20C15_01790 [Planctomycetota bacterium]
MITCLLTIFAMLLGAAPSDDPALTAERTPAEVLANAARFQRGDTPLEARPERFHGRFYVTIHKPEGGTVTLGIERFWTRHPERVLTRRQDGVLESDTSVGYDGSTAWFQDHRTGDVLLYSADPVAFEADLALLRQDLRLTEMLLESALIDSLAPRLRDVRVLRRETLLDSYDDPHPVTVISAVMDDEIYGPDPSAPPPSAGASAPRLRVQLAVDDDTGAIRRVRLATMDRSEVRSMELHVKEHARNTQGLQVPAMLDLYEDGELSLRLGVVPASDSDDVVFEIDPELDLTRFDVPDSSAGAPPTDADQPTDDAR